MVLFAWRHFYAIEPPPFEAKANFYRVIPGIKSALHTMQSRTNDRM